MIEIMRDALARALVILIVAPLAIFSAVLAGVAACVCFIIAVVRKLGEFVLRGNKL